MECEVLIIPILLDLETKETLSPLWALAVFCLWSQVTPQVTQEPVATSRAESLPSCSLLR